MSEIRVNNITNREGSAGPSVAGIPVVDSNSHFVVPSGKTVGRYIEENTIVTDGLIFYVDAGIQDSWDQGNQLGLTTSYWRDLSGNDFHVPVVNLPSYSASNGGSLLFDGVNDSLEIPSQPGPLNPSYISFECWFKYDSNATQGDTFIGGRGDTGFNGYWLGTENNNTASPGLQFSVATSSSNVTRAKVNYTKGLIYHTIGTWDGTDAYGLKLYLNGNYVSNGYNYSNGSTGSNQMSGPIRYSSMSNGFIIGNNDGFTGTRYWTGNIYEMRIYNRALTAQEVLQNFNATKDRYGI
jgi:hypothetical protein